VWSLFYGPTKLTAGLLLNEVQKQNRKIEALEARLAALEALLSATVAATATGGQ
jgi:hypothetical protein